MECFSFNTAAVPEGDRVLAWHEANRRYCGDLRVEALGQAPMDAQLEAYQVGKLKMYRIDAPAHRVSRERKSREFEGDSYYKLVLQLGGEAHLLTQGGDILLRPGDWSLYDPRVPYSISSAARSRLMVVQIARADLRGLALPKLHTCEASSPARVGLHAVLAGVLRALSEQLASLPDASGGAISDAILTLVASTLAQEHLDEGDPLLNGQVKGLRIKQYIGAHLHDPGLDIHQIAQALHCSKRYLHRAFELEACGIERYIWNARLERCHAALTEPRAARRGVSEVAFAWGFNSSAHFSRLFRERYGVSASELRKKTLAAGS